jgi:hypothetical protein
MQIVMGEMNGVRLLDFMNAAPEKCTHVTAAVAYATHNNPFFDHCLKHKIHLEYFGLLDEDQAVSVSVLQQLLDAGPLAASASLIKGHFHSKIIWWHGFGAYIGSANLTSNAWFTNVECGVFFEEGEIIGTKTQADLEQQFEYLRTNSAPVTKELLKALSSLSPAEKSVYVARRKLKEQFDLATKDIPTHAGLTTYGPHVRNNAFTKFSTEWSNTLQLLRGLSGDFHRLNRRPVWVAADADPTVHFDQFLHAYYYVRVREEKEEFETAKSVELVNHVHSRNKLDKAKALREAVDWWSSLETAPYGEDKFISTIAPGMRERFAPEVLARWTLQDFQEVFFDVHAFRMHARQVRNVTLGLPKNHNETVQARSNRVAKWLWEQPRSESQKHIRELLQFVIWGPSPDNIAERLWLAVTDDKWRYDHFGQSTLGEAIGWARPDAYPPRNNRTNKALKALGHDVRMFSN